MQSLWFGVLPTLSLSLVLGAVSARADFWQGNCDDEYHSSGTFSVSVKLGLGGILPPHVTLASTHSGVFYFGFSARREYDGEGRDLKRYELLAYIDLEDRGFVPPPWEDRHHDLGGLIEDWTEGLRIGEAERLSAPFHVSGGEDYHLGDYRRTYITHFYAPTEFYWDGQSTLTVNGSWTYDSVLYDEHGDRPMVPEASPTLLLAGVGFLGLIGLKRWQRKGGC